MSWINGRKDERCFPSAVGWWWLTSCLIVKKRRHFLLLFRKWTEISRQDQGHHVSSLRSRQIFPPIRHEWIHRKYHLVLVFSMSHCNVGFKTRTAEAKFVIRKCCIQVLQMIFWYLESCDRDCQASGCLPCRLLLRARRSICAILEE